MKTVATVRILNGFPSLTWLRGSSWFRRGMSSTLPVVLVVGCGGGSEPARSPEAEAPSDVTEEQQGPAPSPESSPAFESESAEQPAAVEDAGDASSSLLEQEFSQLEQALQQGADCPSAEHFRGRVCSLAERICQIAAEVPNSTRAHGDCEDAKDRCEQANRRFADVCSNR